MSDAALTAALMMLAQANIPPDVQELLMWGDPMRSIPPSALGKAISHAILAAKAEQKEADAEAVRGCGSLDENGYICEKSAAVAAIRSGA